MTPAKAFNQRLISKAGLSNKDGEAIASFTDLPMLVPRGKFTLDLFEEYAKFHGKTNDYKIMYKDIRRVFQLERQDLNQMATIIQLDRPLKQGQTLHHFLIIQVEKELVHKTKVNLSAEEIQQKYGGKFDTEVSGPMYLVLAKLFQNIFGVDKIIISTQFKSNQNNGA